MDDDTALVRVQHRGDLNGAKILSQAKVIMALKNVAEVSSAEVPKSPPPAVKERDMADHNVEHFSSVVKASVSKVGGVMATAPVCIKALAGNGVLLIGVVSVVFKVKHLFGDYERTELRFLLRSGLSKHFAPSENSCRLHMR